MVPGAGGAVIHLMTMPKKIRGRPPLARRAKRSHVVHVRLTPEERDALIAAATAASLSLSAYLRHHALGMPEQRVN